MNYSINKSYNQRAFISELFTSIQGEGIFVGYPQLFVRFSGCNVKPACDYCDSVFKRKKELKFYNNKIHNPISPIQLTNIIQKVVLDSYKLYSHNFVPVPELKTNHFHSLGLTGGEPLLFADFLTSFIPLVKQDGFKIYLETNGILACEFRKISTLIDYIAMDIKLPSSCKRAYWKEHEQFLEHMVTKTNCSNKYHEKHFPQKCFVKIVITSATRFYEVKKAISLIGDIDSNIPVVLQPVTPYKKIRAPHQNMLLFFQQYALNYLKNVRIIPQIHKILKMP